MKEKTDIDDNILTVNFRKFTQLNNKTQLNEKIHIPRYNPVSLCSYSVYLVVC